MVNSAEQPWLVREVNSKVKSWIDRLGFIWVEGQITQLNVKPSWKNSYITLRDPEVEASVQLTCPTNLIRGLDFPLGDGDRIVVFAKPDFYTNRGSFSLAVHEIRPVGVGELLARIEKLRHQLAAEGLFAPERKKPIPFLPIALG